MKNKISTVIIVTSFIMSLVSCDKDFVDVGSGLSGAQNFTSTVRQYPVTAYSKATGPVQVNGLPFNYIGILKDDTYNTTTTANIITEIVPTEFNKDFGTNPTIENVTFHIPYFSTIQSTDEDGNNTYVLDSIYGDTDVEYTIELYKSNYLLRELDPSTSFEENQEYFSDAYTDLNIQSQEGDLLYTFNNFKPNENEVVIEETDADGNTEVVKRFAPGLIIQDLYTNNETFWDDLMSFQDGDDSVPVYFTNANNFKEFFRGLILKVQGTDGSMIALNLGNTNAQIVVEYTNTEDDGGDFTFNFSGITVNTLENASPLPTITGDETNGDDKLFLKGFDGAFTIVDLFGNEDLDNNNLPDELENFQSNKERWLINEANLTFYVKQDEIIDEEPTRVVLYDIKNRLPIVDYFIDQTVDATNPGISRSNYSVPLQKDSNGEGKYKIRLTEHINNILLRDSTNTKLGLYVTNNINNIGESSLKNELTLNQSGETITVNSLPQNSVLSNKGTILYGATSNVPDNKKIKFEIFYSEENQ